MASSADTTPDLLLRQARLHWIILLLAFALGINGVVVWRASNKPTPIHHINYSIPSGISFPTTDIPTVLLRDMAQFVVLMMYSFTPGTYAHNQEYVERYLSEEYLLRYQMWKAKEAALVKDQKFSVAVGIQAPPVVVKNPKTASLSSSSYIVKIHCVREISSAGIPINTEQVTYTIGLVAVAPSALNRFGVVVYDIEQTKALPARM